MNYIRNSLLDRLASLGGKVVFCIKGSCDVLVPISSIITEMADTYQLLEKLWKTKNFFTICRKFVR